MQFQNKLLVFFSLIMLISTIAVLFLLYFFGHRHPLNYILLGIFTVSLSFSIGLTCAFTSGKHKFPMLKTIWKLIFDSVLRLWCKYCTPAACIRPDRLRISSILTFSCSGNPRWGICSAEDCFGKHIFDETSTSRFSDTWDKTFRINTIGLFSNNLLISLLVTGKIILEAVILTAVVVISLTLYTFWAAKRGHDFSFLGPFLSAALTVLIFFSIIQVSIMKESRAVLITSQFLYFRRRFTDLRF